MAKELRDIKKLLAMATYMDSYGEFGSDFCVCRICERESGAGLLARENWHSPDCPVPMLSVKYAKRGKRSNVKLRGCRAFRQSLLNAGLGAVTLQRSTKPNTRKKAVNNKFPLHQTTKIRNFNKTCRLPQTKTGNENLKAQTASKL